jgi:hypothetical protein
MILQVDARNVQMLLSVLQRTPATVAEQLVCEEGAALLVQLTQGEAQPAQPPMDGADRLGQ